MYYRDMYNKAVKAREELIADKASEENPPWNVSQFKNRYYNESLGDLLTNVSEKNRIIEYEGQLVQQINPVFLDPKPAHILDYRAHFFAPQKNLLGYMVNTYWFNLFAIWIMTLALYAALYTELLRKMARSTVVNGRTYRKGK
jgi:hypothetical protein